MTFKAAWALALMVGATTCSSSTPPSKTYTEKDVQLLIDEMVHEHDGEVIEYQMQIKELNRKLYNVKARECT